MAEEECRAPAGSILYVWGYNQSGQTGRDAFVRVRHPAKVTVEPSSRHVVAISCGLHHTAAVASNGSLFTWGSNEFGQLGDGTEVDSNRPVRVKALKNETVISVACGANCTAAITDSKDYTSRGKLWVWGQNQSSNYPRLFTGAFSKETIVTQVSCGGAHVAALSEHGVLQTWGYNEHGQLGRGFSSEGLQGAKVVSSFVRFLDEPVDESVRVKQVACGEYHTVAIANNGDVYTWGLGSSGQLGHRSLQCPHKEILPRRVVTLEDVAVKHISAGAVHTCAVCSTGGLYMWGGSHTGLLGLGPQHDARVFFQRIPVLVIQSGVRSVACGHCHTLAVMANGQLLGFGYNGYGQADTGNGSYAWYPSPIDWCVGEVKCLAAGGGHSAVLTHASTLKDLCELKLVDCVTPSSVSLIADVAHRLNADSLARFCAKFREHLGPI